MIAAAGGRYIIGGWLLLAALALPLALRLPDALGDHGLVTDGAYAKAQARLERGFRLPDEPVYVLFRRTPGVPEKPFREAIARYLESADRVSGVDVAASPLKLSGLERDGCAYAVLTLPGDPPQRGAAIERLRERIAEAGGDLSISMTGKPVVQEDVNRLSRRDLMAAEAIGVPVAFALLAGALGGWRPAFIPILAGGISVLIAMAVLYGFGASGMAPLSVFVQDVIPMVGMAVSIDFALLIVSRFGEEKAHRSEPEALAAACRTSGRVVVVSVGCVLLAAAGTLWIRMPIFRSAALGTLVVIAVSALVNLTFVPALLYALRGRIPARTYGSSGLWRIWANAVMRKPVAASALALGALAVCWLPARTLELGVPGPESLPKDQESRVVSKMLAEHFGSVQASVVYVLADSGEGASEETVRAVRRSLEGDPDVLSVRMSVSRVNADDTLLTVWLRGGPDSKEAMDWVRDREAKWGPAGVLIGGEAKYRQEVHDEVYGRIAPALGFILLSNGFVLAAAFRSLLLPLKAVLMNLAGIAASFGLLSWLFQSGRFGLEPTAIAIMVPVFIFGLAFGVSMDYGVFLLSRIYEAYRISGDNDAAVREGLAAFGKVITLAAAIMIAVTAPFALAGVSGVKQLGIGIAAALFLDATLVRLVMVPAFMKLLGRWNWWLPLAGAPPHERR
jgi:RND superfamily putative drug exporter